jgi:hypothetical protein
MFRAIDTRLRRLESVSSGDGRTFIFGEVKAGQAKKRELLAAGVASPDDVFIFTGVPNSDPASYTMYEFRFFGRRARWACKRVPC